MGNIITLDKHKSQACMNEVNQVLQKHGMALSPSVLMTMQGMQFKIDIVPIEAGTGMGPIPSDQRGK